jgi:hypothetical protein
MARSKTTAKGAPNTLLSFRISTELRDALDAERARLQEEMPGITIDRSMVARAVLGRALLRPKPKSEPRIVLDPDKQTPKATARERGKARR